MRDVVKDLIRHGDATQLYLIRPWKGMFRDTIVRRSSQVVVVLVPAEGCDATDLWLMTCG